MRAFTFSFVAILGLSATCLAAKPALNKSALTLPAGGAEQLHAAQKEKLQWTSSNPAVAKVYQNGFVIGLSPGDTRVEAREPQSGLAAECVVTVGIRQRAVVEAITLKQFPDSQEFSVNGRRCFGSELNGQRASSPDERRNTRSNRVINPNPLLPHKLLEWEVEEGTEIYDGAGILMGTVGGRLKAGGRMVPVSKFNFGMSKVIDGKLCLYAFAVSIKPAAGITHLVDPEEVKDGEVGTSAWLPLDKVIEKELLLERVGVGKVGLPALPLESRGRRITGGNPKMYMTGQGEMSIVRSVGSGPVPSHYLKRWSGTINVIYSVPGFGLGGQGLDSFLINDSLMFYPAIGAKVFVQPTYFPLKHPQAGKVSPKTMTFFYGAVQGKSGDPVYGWVAKEALAY